MAQQQRDKTEAVGISVYHTKKYKNVYYDIFTKKAYAIFNDEVSKFNTFSMKGLIAFLIAFVIYYYLDVAPLISIGVGFGIYIAIYLYFEFVFLKKLTEIDNFEKPESEPIVKRIADNNSSTKLILLLAMAILFVILCFINTEVMGYEGVTKYLNYVLGFVGCIFVGFYVMALITKNRK